MEKTRNLKTILLKYTNDFAPIVPLDFRKEQYLVFDFSIYNTELKNVDFSTVEKMQNYTFTKIAEAQVKAGIGGYGEERDIYQRSQVFDSQEGSRSVHLGVDIWMPAQTPIFAPLDSKVHSFANNDNFGDYGGTIILEHQLEAITFYTLYGHLSLKSLENLFEGKEIKKGEEFAQIGIPEENGHWAEHLHFQVIADMQGKKGDFMGVAHKTEKDFYLDLCPDPQWILGYKM